MCDGRPFASPLFRRLAGRGPFFRGFPFRWALQFAFSLTRCLTLQDATPCSRKDPLHECGRPSDTLLCLFFTALWLQQSQSILVQEIQPAKDFDLTCRCPKPSHAHKWGPCPLSGQWLHLHDPANPALHLFLKNYRMIIQETLSQLPHIYVGGAQLQRDSLDRNTRVHIPDGGPRCVTWNTGGLIGSVSTSQISRERKLNYFKRPTENNNVICLQEVRGKDEFLQDIQVWAPRFSLYGTFLPGNVNAGGSAICIHKDLLSDDAIVTHVITCQGRDHVVNVRSGRRNLVVVNVHLELELTLRSFRERLCLITSHLPQYPNAIGMIMGDFNICEPEEGRFNVLESNFHRR